MIVHGNPVEAKILGGLLKACEKRPITTERLEHIVDEVERQCLEAFDKEVPSKVIGELMMDQLRSLDQVAYVRFASVYRDFKDPSDFAQFIEKAALDEEDAEEG